MKKYIMRRYPRDPPVEVLELTRQEFLERCPRGPIVMESWGEEGYKREEFPMEEDEICCDFCNNDPGEVVFLLGESRGYCAKCAQENWMRYCKEVKSK